MTRNLWRLVAALLFIVFAGPAFAQWQVPAHAVPLGKGAGSGFGSAAAGASGTVFLGQGTTTDPAFATMAGDCSIVAAGTITCAKSNGVTVPSSGTSGGIPYYSSSSAISSSGALTANRLVIGGGAGLAPSVLGSLGTTTTLLHGNASGAPTFGAVVSGDLNITGTTCTNQFVTAISSAAAGTCTTDTLAGAQHANQGSTTTVLHGNASGNPSWGSVAISSDVSGLGTGVATALAVNVGSAGAPVVLNGAGGTPSAINLANATALPVSAITASTSSPLGVGSVELGHASDTTLARGAAGRLTVEGVNVPTISSTDTLSSKTLASPISTGTDDVQQALLLSGDISPTQITANTNDYAPTGFATATTLRLNTDAARNITGLAGGTGGRVVIIHNVGGFNIVLTNQDALSTAGNRFLFGGDVTLAADTSITLKYDVTSSRWRAITSPGAGGGGGGGVSSVTIAAGTGISVVGTCTITSSGTCTVSQAAQDRQNALLDCADSSKSLAIAIRRIETYCDGYKASDGINAGSSSNYAVNTTSGFAGPTTSTSPISGATGTTMGNATTRQSNAFDGTTSQDDNNTAEISSGTSLYVGKVYSPAKRISQALVYGANNSGYVIAANPSVTLTLYGKNGTPSTGTDGTALGTITFTDTTNESAARTIVSTDTTTTYTNVWVNVGTASAAHLDVAEVVIYEFLGTNNMTLVTTSQTADASVSNGRALLEIDPIDAITLNTDLTAEVTCDGGSHWASATLSSIGKGQAGRTVVETADTACTAGSSFAARIKTANSKLVNLYKTGVTVH